MLILLWKTPYVYFALPMIFLGVVLPDIFEPNVEKDGREAWKHRRYFHTQEVFIATLILFIVMFILGFLWRYFFFISFLSEGYAFHLFVDAVSSQRKDKNGLLVRKLYSWKAITYFRKLDKKNKN
jgi:hypothetical protein